jgi:hypothetical protein
VTDNIASNNPRADVRKLQDEIKTLKAFIEKIEQIGGNVDPLKTSVKALELAVNTGGDIGDAAQETSQILKEYTDELYRACPKDDSEYICQAHIDRKWQARTIKWTLSIDQKNSVVNLSIRNILRRYVPDAICKRLDSCR